MTRREKLKRREERLNRPIPAPERLSPAEVRIYQDVAAEAFQRWGEDDKNVQLTVLPRALPALAEANLPYPHQKSPSLLLALCRQLEDKRLYDWARYDAARALGVLGEWANPKAQTWLFGVMTARLEDRQENTYVRHFATRAIGALTRGASPEEQPARIDKLIALLQDHDGHCRFFAAHALCALRASVPPEARPRLIATLLGLIEGRFGSSVLINAAHALVVLGAAATPQERLGLIARLIELAQDDDSELREAAVIALGGLVAQGAEPSEAFPALFDLLIEVFRKQDRRLWVIASQALTAMGAWETPRAHGASPGQTQVLTTLLEGLRDRSDYTREAAANALSALGAPGIRAFETSGTLIAALRERLNDENHSVRVAAADALAVLGETTPLARTERLTSLVTVVKKEQGEYSRLLEAGAALARLGTAAPPDASAALFGRLAGVSEYLTMRQTAAAALRTLSRTGNMRYFSSGSRGGVPVAVSLADLARGLYPPLPAGNRHPPTPLTWSEVKTQCRAHSSDSDPEARESGGGRLRDLSIQSLLLHLHTLRDDGARFAVVSGPILTGPAHRNGFEVQPWLLAATSGVPGGLVVDLATLEAIP